MTSRPEGAKEAVTRERIARVGQAAFERNAVGRTIPENWLKAADAILVLCVEYAREQVEAALGRETSARETILAHEYKLLEAQLQTLRGGRDQARETNTRLNRRCQEYERGLAEKVAPLKGQSFGRGLANAAAEMHLARAEKAEADLATLTQEKAALEAAVGRANKELVRFTDVQEDRNRWCEQALALKDKLAALEARERAHDPTQAIWQFIGDQHYGFNRHEDTVSTGGWQACRREPCVTFKAMFDRYVAALAPRPRHE